MIELYRYCRRSSALENHQEEASLLASDFRKQEATQEEAKKQAWQQARRSGNSDASVLPQLAGDTSKQEESIGSRKVVFY